MAKTQISAMVDDEIYAQGKASGIKWGFLVQMGLEAINLRKEKNDLVAQNQKLQVANGHLQRAIYKLEDEMKGWKAQEGP